MQQQEQVVTMKTTQVDNNMTVPPEPTYPAPKMNGTVTMSTNVDVDKKMQRAYPVKIDRIQQRYTQFINTICTHPRTDVRNSSILSQSACSSQITHPVGVSYAALTLNHPPFYPPPTQPRIA
jgi:hypothetical protein